MTKKLIEFHNVSIKAQKKIILEDFSVEFDNQIGVIGLIGLNGAGKTTFIKSIFKEYQLFSGTIDRHTNEIAFCTDVPDFPTNMTAIEVLRYSRWLASKTKQPSVFFEEILDLVGLSDYKNSDITHFSRGMKQRLGIASVLVLEPKIIFFDEPTSALDPKGREDIIEIMSNLGKTKLVVFSSHILNDVQKIAERIIVIHKGRKIFDDNINLLLEQSNQKIDILLQNIASKNNFQQLLEVSGIELLYSSEKEYLLSIKAEDIYKVLQLIDVNIAKDIVSISRMKSTLEEGFDKLIDGRMNTC